MGIFAGEEVRRVLFLLMWHEAHPKDEFDTLGVCASFVGDP